MFQIPSFDHLTFLVRPDDAGQIVEISYAYDSATQRVVRRVYDQSDRTDSFATAEDDRETFEPYNNQRFSQLDWEDVDMGTLAARLLDGDRDDEAGPTFTRLNNAGEGFDPEEEIEDWDLVYRANTDDEVSIYADGDDAILVGDANGAWAVRVSG